jgi:type II secretory pathway pseudopilin PulG
MYCARCGHEVQTLAAACPTCGKPASGAPMTTGKGISALVVVAAVAAGGLVLITIIGIIAAIAVPNMLNAMNRSRQKRTMADIRTIATALENHAAGHGFYPDAESVGALVGELQPSSVHQLPLTDGWGFPLKYQCWQVNPEFKGCDTYAIASPARDGVLEHVDLADYGEESMRTSYFDCDIVYRDGAFIRYPEGFQGR